MNKHDKELLAAVKRENGMDAHTIAIVKKEVDSIKQERSWYYRIEKEQVPMEA